MCATATHPLAPLAGYGGGHGLARPTPDSLHFDDAQEQACALTGWNQDYLQLSAGAFRGKISQRHGTGIKLFAEQVQQSVFQTGVLPQGVLALGVPLATAGPGMFCGKACAADDLHVFSGASGFEFRASRQHTMLGVELQLAQDWLHNAAGALPAQACTVRVTPAALCEIKTYLLTLFQAAQASPSLLSTPSVVSSVGDFLFEHLEQVDAAGHDRRGDSLAPWRLVQQACALAHEERDQVTTVAQLCVDLGVSRRTLQNCFQRVLDVSPSYYLKAVRLGQARRALKQMQSVTQAATASGFWHFGHFSQDYRAMFGEFPSDTMRRHARRA